MCTADASAARAQTLFSDFSCRRFSGRKGAVDQRLVVQGHCTTYSSLYEDTARGHSRTPFEELWWSEQSAKMMSRGVQSSMLPSLY